MTSSINDAIASAAAEAARTSTQAVAPTTQGGAQLPTAAGPARTLQDFMDSSSMNVDAYLGVNEFGMRFGKDKTFVQTLEVDLCLKDAKAGYTYRFNAPGAGVQYLTSWDGVTEAKTKKNWAAACAEAKAVDGNSYASDLVELPAELVEEFKRPDQMLPPGTVIGLSISYQNSKAFGAWIKKVAPIYGFDAKLRVRLTAVPKKNAHGNEYGVYNFEVLGLADELDNAPAEPAAKGGKKAA